jgi:septal ring factor EnvC (AmiA/AmiB activator)
MLGNQVEEMARQVRTLRSDMDKVEAKMGSVTRALEKTERKASRLHRKLQSVSPWNPGAGLLR